jgi:hypothetical protein
MSSTINEEDLTLITRDSGGDTPWEVTANTDTNGDDVRDDRYITAISTVR